MTNRIQTLRSSTPGARPVGRQPGELYVNWPDLQLGVVDSTSTPVDLIAVRYFSTLTSYAIGEFIVQAGQLYRALQAVAPGPFNPAQWTANLMAGDPISGYLPLVGGSLTGGLFFAGTPVNRFIAGMAGTNARWLISVGDNAVESGANAGSTWPSYGYGARRSGSRCRTSCRTTRGGWNEAGRR